jgi:hypothetical protein
VATRKNTCPLAVSSKNSNIVYGSSTDSPPEAVEMLASIDFSAPSSERS